MQSVTGQTIYRRRPTMFIAIRIDTKNRYNKGLSHKGVGHAIGQQVQHCAKGVAAMEVFERVREASVANIKVHWD
jgi:hypothetical protein